MLKPALNEPIPVFCNIPSEAWLVLDSFELFSFFLGVKVTASLLAGSFFNKLPELLTPFAMTDPRRPAGSVKGKADWFIRGCLFGSNQ